MGSLGVGGNKEVDFKEQTAAASEDLQNQNSNAEPNFPPPWPRLQLCRQRQTTLHQY
jgi:hypothetical protein